jgi:hypothetical protein
MIMSVSSVAPLPTFQPLTPTPNTNNKNGQNGANGPNDTNKSNGTNGANTNNASGQTQGPAPADGGDNGNQAAAPVVTHTNPPNQQPPLPQNGQGIGLSINMLV